MLTSSEGGYLGAMKPGKIARAELFASLLFISLCIKPDCRDEFGLHVVYGFCGRRYGKVLPHFITQTSRKVINREDVF